MNDEEMTTPLKVFLMIVLGVLGGIVGNLTIFSVSKFPIEMKEHALLSGPFLAFLSFLILLTVFYSSFRNLLSRGSLTFKWGSKQISIQDIEQNFEQEISEQLQILEDDLEAIKKHVAFNSENSNKKESNDLAKVLNEFDAHSDDERKIIYHLGTSRYKWRNRHTLAKRTNFTEDKIERLAQQVPNLIVRGKGKSGNILFRLTDDAMTRFKS